MSDDKPFEGNLFEYEGGMLYFHGGIDAFCVRNNVEIVEIREGGEIWCLRSGKKSWEEYPFEDSPAHVVGIKRN